MRSILNTNVITGLGMCKVCTEAIRSSPLRSSVNTNVVTGLCMCEVCAESVNVQKKKYKKHVQKPKHGPPRKARNRVRCVFYGRRTSRFAGISIHIYMYGYTHIHNYISI